jgi:hypothetical protein
MEEPRFRITVFLKTIKSQLKARNKNGRVMMANLIRSWRGSPEEVFPNNKT